VTPARRQKLLLGLLGVLVLAMIWNYLPMGEILGGGGGGDEAAAAGPPLLGGSGGVEDAGESGPPRRRIRRGDDVPTKDVIDLRIAALETPPRAPAPGRDPWRFIDPPPPKPAPPPPPPPPPTAEELAARRAAEQAAFEAAERARLEALKPKPPPFTLKLLGSFGPPNRKIATFTDDKGAVWPVREGEVLQGKFIVAKIGYESVDIKFVGFPDEPVKRVAVGR
jgi:hypothetical protein